MFWWFVIIALGVISYFNWPGVVAVALAAIALPAAFIGSFPVLLTVFGVGLGLLEIIFFSVFFLLLVVGTSWDRRGRESPKWYIFGVGLIVFVAWFWKDWTFSGAWETMRSWHFWEPVLAYLLAGLIYSILEFVLDVRRTAREYKVSWDRFLSSKISVEPKRDSIGRDSIRVSEALTLNDSIKDAATISAVKDAIKNFVNEYDKRNRIVGLTVKDGKPEPLVNKLELAESIGAWTFFWPPYLVSLIIGDLLTEIFNFLSEILVKISGRFVAMSFKDVFSFTK